MTSNPEPLVDRIRRSHSISNEAIAGRFEKFVSLAQNTQWDDVSISVVLRRAAIVLLDSNDIPPNKSVPFLRETISFARGISETGLLVIAYRNLIRIVEASENPDTAYLVQLNFSLGSTLLNSERPQAKNVIYHAYDLFRQNPSAIAPETAQKLTMLVSKLKQKDGDLQGAEDALKWALNQDSSAL